MTHKYRFRYVASLCLLLSASSAFSQTGKVLKTVKNDEGTVKSLVFDTKSPQARMSNVKQLFKAHLSATDNDELRVRNAFVDQVGVEHTRYQQYYKGIKVQDGSYIVHAKNGLVNAMNGEFQSLSGIDTKPSISSEAALQAAMAYVGADLYLWENAEEAALINYEKPQGELVIIDKKLAYKFDVYALKPISRAEIFVDAASSEIIFKNDIIHHADAIGTAATRYSGSKQIHTESYSGGYRLRDVSRGQGIETYDMNMGVNYNNAVDFVDNDNNWTSSEWNNSNKDNAALDAHWAAEETYEYFLGTFARNSFDGNGAKIKSYVHFDLVEYGYPSNDNAFWDGSRMTYGDGTSLPPLTTLDVAAHEIGHAVCTYTANLNYSYESGAMNEGFSDIWAACVEYFAAPDKQTWLLGEDLGTVIRSLEDPKSAGQPDTYQGSYWATGSADNGGVHTNSGVLNHWFYILSQGKSGSNDKGDSYSVTGIGIEDAARIAYLLESAYLSSGSDYADAREYAIQAAIELFKDGNAPDEMPAEAIATQNAWYAVGVGAEYSEGGNDGGGDDNGGGDPGSCAQGAVKLTLTYDNYPEETSWTLKNSSGATVASGSGASASKNATYTETFDLAAGTYSFTIADQYGDGICCSYGNGSYTLTDQATGSTLATGGAYGSGETVSICVDGGSDDGDGGSTPPSNYCSSKGSNSSDEWIDLVSLGSINNSTSANGGYGDFTSKSTNLPKGSSQTITFSAGFSGSSYNEYWSVWIDYNRDGDFTDAGEQVVAGSSSSSGNLSGTFTVPTSASTGATRMRVAMKYNAAPSSCESFNYGEVEDYTVNIGQSFAMTAATEATHINATAIGNEVSGNLITVSPNPVSAVAKIAVANAAEGYTLELRTLNGKVIESRIVTNREMSIDMSGLPNGIYIVSVKTPREVINSKIVKQ